MFSDTEQEEEKKRLHLPPALTTASSALMEAINYNMSDTSWNVWIGFCSGSGFCSGLDPVPDPVSVLHLDSVLVWIPVHNLNLDQVLDPGSVLDLGSALDPGYVLDPGSVLDPDPGSGSLTKTLDEVVFTPEGPFPPSNPVDSNWSSLCLWTLQDL